MCHVLVLYGARLIEEALLAVKYVRCFLDNLARNCQYARMESTFGSGPEYIRFRIIVAPVVLVEIDSDARQKMLVYLFTYFW